MIILITGAARGLGYHLVKRFAQEGHTILAAVRNIQKADKLIDLSAGQSNIFPMEMDVADWESIKNCAEKVTRDFSCIDVFINNAGVLFESDKRKPIMDVDVEVLQKTIAVNVEGPILALKAFYPLLSAGKNPRFYIITSEGRMNGHWEGLPIYSLSKIAAGKAAGIIGASVDKKFQVLAIHPGRMDTDMGHATAQIKPEEAANGIYLLTQGKEAESWYVDYLGKKMEA